MSDTKTEGNEPHTIGMDLKGVIGFNGSVHNGLVLHPDDEHIIFPLGSTVVVKNLIKGTQHFLQKDGHDTSVCSLTLSKSGKYLASGQETHMGFSADICVWDLESCEVVHKLKLHKGKVQDLAFSSDENYLVTLGGQDDNKVVMWDMKTGNALCGANASNDLAVCVRFLNLQNDTFVTAGRYNLRVWKYDRVNRKLIPEDCQMGQLKRIIKCLTVDDKDEYLYCGTDSGDLIQVNLKTKLYQAKGPSKNLFTQGIQTVAQTRNGNLIVGGGDGTVGVILADKMETVKRLKLDGCITSIYLNAKGDHFFVGTASCNMYLVQLKTFDYELRNTCHFGRINDIAFAYDYSALFATCSKTDIRIWNASTRNELLRITVPNHECLSLAFSRNGKSIISGWNDGKIRAFTPQTGKLMYTINDAHHGGVTAIVGTSDSAKIISGGEDGQVRVWSIASGSQKMIASMKEHKSRINQLKINSEDSECLSASDDGACILWSLERFHRNNAVFASTQFKTIFYHPDEGQILTAGTDRKITYWDALDGEPIRIIDASPREITTMDVNVDGEHFLSGGADKLVRVWNYDEGTCQFSGVGHSGCITKIKMSPDSSFIVSVGEEGAVFIWENPISEGSYQSQDAAKQEVEVIDSMRQQREGQVSDF